MDEITKAFRTCSTFRPKPLTFQVAMPEEKIKFNQEVAVDIFWLHGRAILHVVDVGTGFCDAKFISGHTVEAVWQAFIEC